MLAWNQIVAVSRAEAKQDILDLLTEVGFAATSWQEGSIALGCVEIGAWIFEKGSTVAASLKTFAFNDTAEDEALDRFSLSHYQNTRIDAVAARRLVTLTCEAGEGPHAIDVGDVIIANADGFQFRNIDDDGETPTYPASYPANIPSGGSIQLIFEADIPGSEANTAAGGVTTMVTTFAGVTVTQDLEYRTGVGKETPARLRVRNATKWAFLPKIELIDDTVEALALAASAAVQRVKVDSSNPRGAGTFDVYVAGATGAVGSNDRDAVKAAIDVYVMGDADACHVEDAPPQALDIAGTVYLASGYDWTVVEPVILAALETWRQSIPLGGFSYPTDGTVPVNEIENVVRNVEIGGVKPVRTVKLTDPLVDVAVASFGHVTEGTWDFSAVLVG